MKKTVITIISAFILFIAVVMVKNAYSYKIPNDEMGIQAVIAMKDVDYLFLGSSSFRKGVNMKELEQELDGSSFMLTYNGNQPMNAMIELQEIIKAGTNVNTLVYEIEPGMIDRGADLSDKRLLWDVDLDSKLQIWNYLKDREDADFFMFFDYWVSSNMDYMITYPVAHKVIAKRYYKGGNDGEDVSEARTEEELMNLPIKEDPGIDQLQLDSIVNIINMCNDNGIELIFLEPPKYKAIYADANFASKHEDMVNLLKENGATYYLGEDLGFDNTNAQYYSDISHMSKEGMEELTKDIIKVIK